MSMYQNVGCAIFIWDGVFQLRVGGKRKKKKQQDETKLYISPLTQILWENQRMFAKNETLLGSGDISGPLVCNRKF